MLLNFKIGSKNQIGSKNLNWLKKSNWDEKVFEPILSIFSPPGKQIIVKIAEKNKYRSENRSGNYGPVESRGQWSSFCLTLSQTITKLQLKLFLAAFWIRNLPTLLLFRAPKKNFFAIFFMPRNKVKKMTHSITKSGNYRVLKCIVEQRFITGPAQKKNWAVIFGPIAS